MQEPYQTVSSPNLVGFSAQLKAHTAGAAPALHLVCLYLHPSTLFLSGQLFTYLSK